MPTEGLSQEQYAEIAIDRPIDGTFHYRVPQSMGDLRVGHMVEVHFATKLEHGIVVGLSDAWPEEMPRDVVLKDVHALIHAEPVASAAQVALARWMAERYRATVMSALLLMLPRGLTGQRDIRVTLIQPNASARDMLAMRIIGLLHKRGPLEGHQLTTSLGSNRKVNWRKQVDQLADEGVVSITPILRPPRMKPSKLDTVTLRIDPAEIERVGPTLGRRSRRAEVLEGLAALGAGVHDAKMLAAEMGTSRSMLKTLEQAGLVVLHEGGGVSLAIAAEDVPAHLIVLRAAERPLRALQVLARAGEPMDVRWLSAQTDITPTQLRRLEDGGYIRLGERDEWREPPQTAPRRYDEPPTLTPDQSAALDTLREALDARTAHTFLLHGVTGSGKTEIYLQAMAHVMRRGQNVLFLVPEIALTPQTTARVAGRFPQQRTVVMHSGLTEAERYDAWRRARTGEVRVVIGPRSAVFAPLANIGLIVLDESHDASYKQHPNIDMPPYRSGPHYHTREVAEQLAAQHGAVVVLGSATPDIQTMYRAEQGRIGYVKLPDRILAHREQVARQVEQYGVRVALPDTPDKPYAHELPRVSVVDMRQELQTGNTSMFSGQLRHALQETLQRHEQALLFLNRRGKNTYVFCRDCGYVAACPNCDTPLIYHADASGERQRGVMRCHRCNHSEPHPTVCPSCGSGRIRYFGAGTQQVEATIRREFPRARVLRWDADTAANAQHHGRFLQRMEQREADIIVGTQMIAKGLDLPLVTLVGILSADTALHLPDYHAGERAFQLLTQVAGRAGRSMLGGRVILQTYQPQHFAVNAAAHHDYHGFYRHELHQRRELGYPPFRRLVRVLHVSEREAHAREMAEQTAEALRAALGDDTAHEVIGPAPAFFTRVARRYRWHVLVRGPNPSAWLSAVTLRDGTYIDIDPLELL